MESIAYTCPETGERTVLDPVQAEIYRELVEEQNVHPADAIVIAYYTDATGPRTYTIDWGRIFVNSTEMSDRLGVVRSWIGTISNDLRRPEYRPALEKSLGRRMVIRMWTEGRLRWLESGAASS